MGYFGIVGGSRGANSGPLKAFEKADFPGPFLGLFRSVHPLGQKIDYTLANLLSRDVDLSLLRLAFRRPLRRPNQDEQEMPLPLPAPKTLDLSGWGGQREVDNGHGEELLNDFGFPERILQGLIGFVASEASFDVSFPAAGGAGQG